MGVSTAILLDCLGALLQHFLIYACNVADTIVTIGLMGRRSNGDPRHFPAPRQTPGRSHMYGAAKHVRLIGPWAPVFALMLGGFVAAPGCTSVQLTRSAAQQASSVADLQYRQVLDNLAMFHLNPHALPSLANMKTGATQVGDTGTLGILGVAALNSPAGISPTITGTRSIVDQWGTAPVTDENALALCRKAFQRALGWPSYITEPEAEGMIHDLTDQVGTNADVSVDMDVFKALATPQIQVPTSSSTPRNALPVVPNNPNNPAKTEDSKTAQSVDDADASAARIVSILSSLDRRITSTLDQDVIDCFVPPGQEAPSFRPHLKHSTGLAKDVIYKVNDFQETLKGIKSDWYQVSREKPKCACYCGRYQLCGKTVYVYVEEYGLKGLADFTLAVQKLSTSFKDVQVVNVPAGIQFSPSLTRPTR
jgi:hypothetical protein